MSELTNLNDELLENMWKQLEDIPCDEDQDSSVGLRLAKSWWRFRKGTDIMDVWDFFNRRHSKGIIHLLYELETV